MQRSFVLFVALIGIPCRTPAQQPVEPTSANCCPRVEIVANRSAGFDNVPEYLSVWIEPTSRLRLFQPTFVAEAREAFGVWSEAGVPVVFDFTADSARAIIRVFWRHRLSEPVTARSTWWKAAGQLERVDVEVALAAHPGVDAPIVRAAIMHEIGHLLGFKHSSERDSIMSYYLSRAELSRKDVQRMRVRFALDARQR